MGMFDTINVDRTLLDPLMEANDFKFELYDEKYYSFQTKDIENALTEYFIEADGNVYVRECDYEILTKEEEEKQRKQSHLGLAFPKIINERKTLDTSIWGYVKFYDEFTTDTERFWVDFEALIQDGKMTSVKVKNVERTLLEEERKNIEKVQKYWRDVYDTWEWQLLDRIRNIKTFFRKLIFPLRKRIEQWEERLLESAKSKAKQ